MARGSTIPQSIIDEVKARTSFFELASEVTHLKRVGRSLVGLCPFHGEKTPSFHVHEEDGFFHCFGCGKKGSVFNFVMETKALSFPEAVRFLAKRAGVPIPEDGSPSEESTGLPRERLIATIRAAEACYRRELERAANARDYLRGRGLKNDTLEKFGVGYAPAGWDFIAGAVRAELERAGAAWAKSPEEVNGALIELGLLRERSQEGEGEQAARGRAYDLLRDRIIFPIRRSDGLPIAFGGRIMSSDPRAPKYLNTPESPLYLKRKTLFGVPQAMNALRKTRRAIVVEGYMDVLAAAESGFEGALASCGTALTEEHARTLARIVERATIVFDGDLAGRKAARRTFEVFAGSGVEADVVILPPDDDPDSLLRRAGSKAFSDLLTTAIPADEFFVRELLDERTHGGDPSPATRGKVAERFAEVSAGIRNPVERESTLRRGAELLGASVESLERLVAERMRRRPVERSGSSPPERRPSAPGEHRGADVQSVPAIRAPESEALRFAGGYGDDSAEVEFRVQPAARQQRKDWRRTLYRQIVVASVVEPQIARSLLELPTITSAGALPEPLVRFLQSLEESGLPPLAAGSSEVREAWAVHLRSFGFRPDGLLDEAERQLAAGGPTGRIGSDYHRLIDLRAHRGILSDLRTAESQSTEESERIRAAQEKLLKRREFERRRQGSD